MIAAREWTVHRLHQETGAEALKRSPMDLIGFENERRERRTGEYFFKGHPDRLPGEIRQYEPHTAQPGMGVLWQIIQPEWMLEEIDKEWNPFGPPKEIIDL